MYTRNLDSLGLTKEYKTVKNYTIEDGFLKVPVQIRYEMSHPCGGFQNASISFGDYNANLNWVFEVRKKTVEELIEQFLWDDTALANFIYEELYPEKSNTNSQRMTLSHVIPFKIIKKEIVQFVIPANPIPKEDFVFFDDTRVISSETYMEGDEIVQMIKSHPRYVESLERVKRIEEENIRIQEERSKQDKKTLIENSYHMWRILNERKEKGEFDQYINQ